MRARTLSFDCLLLFVLTGIGCAGPQKPTREASPPAGLQTLTSEAATEIVFAEDLCPLGSWTATFARLDGDEISDTVHACAPTDRFGATWAQSDGDERTRFLTADDAGDIVMTAAIDHGEHALTLFDPPLLIAPRTLAPGDRREARSTMRVVDEHDQNRRREGGTGTRVIEYTQRQRITTPLGTFLAPRIDVQFHADLALADVKQTEKTWFLPGRGVVAQQRVEHLKIMGLVSHTTQRRVVRVR